MGDAELRAEAGDAELLGCREDWRQHEDEHSEGEHEERHHHLAAEGARALAT